MAEKTATKKSEEASKTSKSTTGASGRAPKSSKVASEQAAAKKTAAKKDTSSKSRKATGSPRGKVAVVATGGKQYVVREGDVLDVEKLADTSEGSKVEFSEVLLVDDGATTKVGEPTVSGAKVSGECVAEGRGKKISVIRFRAKSRYFKNKGHRQPYTRVKITSIK